MIDSSVWASVIIQIIVAGFIYWLVTFGLGKIKLPEPFAKIANAILVLSVVMFLINALMTLTGHPVFRWR